jgi:arylsulfatase A-like enzyme
MPKDASKQPSKQPNILVIFGDDIGTTNLSCYSDGLMGYETPHIDRLANEGIRFLHYYGEQSCTAGRAAFLTGQHGIRTGLTKVGFPGAPMGMSQLDPSIGGLLKNLGYDRSVRQEPCRRPERDAADRQRLRRVSRQSLSPQLRRGTPTA